MKEVGTIYLLHDLEKFREQEAQRSHCGKSSVPLVFSPWRQKASNAIVMACIKNTRLTIDYSFYMNTNFDTKYMKT